MIVTRSRLAALAVVAVCACGIAARAQSGKAAAKEPRLIYFSKQEVDANFVHPKGQDDTLFHSDYGSESFIVKTSGRTKTLAAETHKTYTDILYIVKGSATLITGGKLVDDITPATYPDGKPFTETTMARSIVGGQSRHLAVGDVVVIPNGLPHWFTDVEGPFWFFNVKSR